MILTKKKFFHKKTTKFEKCKCDSLRKRSTTKKFLNNLIYENKIYNQAKKTFKTYWTADKSKTEYKTSDYVWIESCVNTYIHSRFKIRKFKSALDEKNFLFLDINDIQICCFTITQNTDCFLSDYKFYTEKNNVAKIIFNIEKNVELNIINQNFINKQNLVLEFNLMNGSKSKINLFDSLNENHFNLETIVFANEKSETTINQIVFNNKKNKQSTIKNLIFLSNRNTIVLNVSNLSANSSLIKCKSKLEQHDNQLDINFQNVMLDKRQNSEKCVFIPNVSNFGNKNIFNHSISFCNIDNFFNKYLQLKGIDKRQNEKIAIKNIICNNTSSVDFEKNLILFFYHFYRKHEYI